MFPACTVPCDFVAGTQYLRLHFLASLVIQLEFNCGDARLRQCDSGVMLSLFGMATVPVSHEVVRKYILCGVTHVLQTTDAKSSATARLERGMRFAKQVLNPVSQMQYAMAA